MTVSLTAMPRVGHVTTPPDSVPLSEALTNMPPPGRVSVMTTLVALLEPTFAIWTVYVTVSPPLTETGPVFVTSRSGVETTTEMIPENSEVLPVERVCRCG